MIRNILLFFNSWQYNIYRILSNCCFRGNTEVKEVRRFRSPLSIPRSSFALRPPPSSLHSPFSFLCLCPLPYICPPMELTKNYEPSIVEDKWNKQWKEKKYFSSVPDGRPPFTVVIPPPNVTGVLHMGHTLNETVQDILVRNARLSGFNACWVPGSDHASIATEAKVVDMLKKEKNIDKSQLSRDEFLRYAFEWKEKYGNIIYSQIEKLGCSVDWDRTTFTMDPHYYQAVMKVFVDLYNKGLIYRGARMINWDPLAKTALSDEEVEHRDIQGRLYHVKYFVTDKPDGTVADTDNAEYVVIATQRPETIMGDTAVCVHPDDERYKKFHGKYVVVPFVNRVVPVITDDYIDPAFGTGVLKVTPAHDINDYNLGLKHNLPVVDTLNEDGTLTEAAAHFAGMERFEARKKVVEELKAKGWLIKEEDYQTRAGYSQRTHCIVEPRISTQWFLSVASLAQKALEPVLDGRIRIHPEERFLNTYKYWLSNMKDWCISRQLWWGQRIPAWNDSDGKYVVAANEEEALEKYKKQYGTSISSLKQDEDVLDTWFSSWLWPMEVFKGVTEPDNADIKYYYPTSVLVTGQDIIFFWVARMIMAGMEYKNEIPFHDVYFTGMVRDKQGRKMSKSLGNSPDLLQLIDKYGADAVRFGIMISSPAGNDLLFDETSPEQGRNFNNKIWNALKLVKMWESRLSAPGAESTEPAAQEALLVMDVSGFSGSVEVDTNGNGHTQENFAVTWFENRLAEVKQELKGMYADFRLSEALKTLYSLIWDDFCSWYLEWVKTAPGQSVEPAVYQKTVEFFTELMHLLHPFMPFVTEEVYHLLQNRNDDLCVRQYSAAKSADPRVLETGKVLKDVISGIRDTRNRSKMKQKDEIKLYVITENQDMYMSVYHILTRQLNASSIAFNTEALGHNVSVVIGKDRFFVESSAPIDNSEEKNGLLKELNHLEGFLASVEKKLSNERFMQNAKPEVIALEQRKKSDAQTKIRVIRESLSRL